MIVSMWMSRNVLTIAPDTPITEAAALMSRRRIRRLPVVEASPTGPRLVGVLTSTDVLHAFPPDVNPFSVLAGAAQRTLTLAADVMKSDPVALPPDAPIEEAAVVMRDRKIGGVPVVRDGRLVGLITESDIFRAFTSIFECKRESVRVTFDVSKCDDPFSFVAAAAVKHKVRVTSLISSHQDDVPVCVIRVEGASVEKMLDDVWRSGHRVLNVLQLVPPR